MIRRQVYESSCVCVLQFDFGKKFMLEVENLFAHDETIDLRCDYTSEHFWASST